MSAPPLVSIVVVSWNAADLLARLLESIERTDYPAWECVVVDNASTDHTRAMIAARFPGVRLVASAENLGPSRGNNAGAAAARGDWLLFLNPDVVVEPDALTELMAHVDPLPDVGIAFPTIVEAHGVEHLRAPQVEEIAAMQGAALGVRRTAFDAIGGFDERLFMYFEDTEICWRAWARGWRVVKDHEAIVHHLDQGHSGGMRRAAMQIRNGLLAHLWHMDARVTASYVARALVKTVVRGVRYRQPEVLGAWTSVARDLPPLLAERRSNLARTTPQRRARLAALEAAHGPWRRRNYLRRLELAVRRLVRLPAPAPPAVRAGPGVEGSALRVTPPPLPGPPPRRPGGPRYPRSPPRSG